MVNRGTKEPTLILIVFVASLVGALYCYDTMSAEKPATTTTSNASCHPDPDDRDKWRAG